MPLPLILYVITLGLLSVIQAYYFGIALTMQTILPFAIGMLGTLFVPAVRGALQLALNRNPDGALKPHYDWYLILSIPFSLCIMAILCLMIGTPAQQIAPGLFIMINLATITVGRNILKSQK